MQKKSFQNAVRNKILIVNAENGSHLFQPISDILNTLCLIFSTMQFLYFLYNAVSVKAKSFQKHNIYENFTNYYPPGLLLYIRCIDLKHFLSIPFLLDFSLNLLQKVHFGCSFSFLLDTKKLLKKKEKLCSHRREQFTDQVFPWLS